MVPVSTFYAAMIELVSLLATAALFGALGMSTGWAIFCAVVVLAAGWGVIAWQAEKRLEDSVLRRAVTKVALVNAAAVVISPFVPLARWLHYTIGLSKQWSGGIACLLAVVALFVVLGFVSLRGQRERKQKAGPS